MQGFLDGGVCFVKKATNNRSLLSDFIFHYSSSTNHFRWASISNHLCWKTINHPSIFIIIIFYLLLYVAEVLNSLINRERRPIRIEFLTLQGKPNTHAWRAKSPTQHFLFLLVLRDRPTALDYRVHRLCTRALARWNRSKDGGEVCPTPQSIRVICFPITIFLGMWLVRSNA